MLEGILIVFWLIILESLLSIDNALVLAIIVSALPKEQQKRALMYGLWGAFIFRIPAVIFAVWLMSIGWFKILGGAYLLYIAYKGLRGLKNDPSGIKIAVGFWPVVIQSELMDIAFSIDSILAAVALTDNKWLIITGGIIGIIAMRYAARGLIKVIEKYPILKKTAYVLVLVIGAKLVASFWWHPPEWLVFGALFAIVGVSLLIGYWQKPRT